MKHCIWISLISLAFVSLVAANRVKDMLYMPIDGAAACFRRHNGTHQFGCSSSRSGSVGVIHIVENPSDIDWLEKNSTAGPYIIVLSFNMFTLNNLERFNRTNNVNGVLLTRNASLERPSSYSPEDTCPNRYSGYKTCDHEWNQYGDSILMKDWPFPMFYVQNQTTLQHIKECYLKHNAHNRENQSERSLCALEMKSFMFAAVNSELCLRRSQYNYNFSPNFFCDPLGDRNIHWPVGPMTDNVKSVIMVIARLDANAIYENLVPGAGSTVTGLATLMATATYLHQILKPVVNNVNVVFSLLNGEAMDYIGSSRFVYDLQQGNFVAIGGKVIKLDQVSSVIELGQLGEGQLYLHASNFKDSPLLKNLQANLKATLLEDSIPPASIQSFLRVNKSLPVVVIANHKEKFVNKYYNSLLDDAEGLSYSSQAPERKLEKSLALVAKSLGDELYRVITGNETAGNLTFIEELMFELLPCYLEKANCELFHAASRPGTKLPNQVLPMYVSVAKSENDVTTLTGQLLALLTGESLPQLDVNACSDKHLLWMAGYDHSGICVNFTANYSSAVSPAFIIDGYDMKSGIYPTWTESVWQSLKMRMFLKPSAAAERLSLIIGSSITFVSFVLVWLVTSKADILFNAGSVDL